MQNISLFDVLFRLVGGYWERLNKRASGKVPVYKDHEWLPQEHMTYNRVDRLRIYWPVLLRDVDEEIKASAEYDSAQRLAENDPVWGKHLNTNVGGQSFSRRLKFHDILRELVKPYLEDDRLIEISQANFTSHFESIHQQFASETITVHELTPLFGFRADVPSIHLADGLCIEKFSQREISDFLNAGIPIAFTVSLPDHASPVYEFGIRHSIKQAKVFGTDRPQAGRKEPPPTDLIIAALNLYKPGTVYPVATITRGYGIFSLGTHSSGAFRPGISSSYYLRNEDVPNFLTLWGQVRDSVIRFPDYLKVAMRRFSQAETRPDIEDQIIDLMISAEALFLSTEKGNQGELKYRLAHRAALFLADTPSEQRTVFEAIKAAYDVRSAIVHGSRPKLPKGPNGSRLNLYDFDQQITELIRKAILKMIQIAHQSASPISIDWLDYMFREKMN